MKRFSSRLGLSTAAALAAAFLVFPRAASADVLATSCEKDPNWCKIGKVSFAKSDTLPIEWSFDTGWVPQGSPAVGKEYDPAAHIAVPGNTARQRLIQSGRLQQGH